MKELFEQIGINIGISVAGFFGSLILIGKKQKSNLRTTFFAIITGVANANYLTPVFIEFLRFDKKYEMSIAFILGFLGVKGVEFISEYLTEKIKKDDRDNQNNK